MKKTNQNGITLVALVITIIILLILAGISIQAITNTGLFAQANKAKKETQRAQVTEWLNLKLMEEQIHNPTGTADEIIEATRGASDGNTELAKMGKIVVVDTNTSTIEDGEQVDVYFYVQVDEDVYKVEMTGTKFIGEQGKFPPVIKLESITNTTNSITIKVKTSRNEEGKIEIYKKSEDDAEYALERTATGEEATGLECTFSGLEQNKNYSIKIVATAKNGQVKEYTKEISTEKQLVNEIKVTPESATLKIGETLDLSITISPEDAYNKNIKWISSNPEVATIEENGKITAVSEGTTIIRAIAQDESGIDAKANVIVTKAPEVLSDVAQIGDYVQYEANGYSEWKVMYKTNEIVYIVSEKCPETLTLSGMDGYNNGITYLNNVASKYLNETYADSSKSIGSMFNYETDIERISAAGLMNIEETYWVANKVTELQGPYNGYYNTSYRVGIINENGEVSTSGVYIERPWINGPSEGWERTFGVRPVVQLKANLLTNGKNKYGKWDIISDNN